MYVCRELNFLDWSLLEELSLEQSNKESTDPPGSVLDNLFQSLSSKETGAWAKWDCKMLNLL